MSPGPARLRIGIDGHVLGKNIGGVERYLSKVVELVPDLLPQHDFIVFVGAAMKARLDPDVRPNVSFVALPVSDPLIQRSVVLPWAVRAHRIDVLQVQRIAPWACGTCKLVLTIHDLTPLLYAKDYPGFRNRIVRRLTPSSIRRADLILCPSQTVCDGVASHFPDAPAPCRPFYLGADRTHFDRPDDAFQRETLQRYAIVPRFIYAPGAVEPRKNLEIVLQALARLERTECPDLVLSGPIRNADYFGRIMRLAAELGVADRVKHLGFIPERDLVTLYHAASLCLAASRDEGFNLMPIEAMACGTPVACSAIAVHRELFGGGAHFFGCDDSEALAQLIDGLLSGRLQSDAAGVGACLARLSWDAMARRMAEAFDGFADGSVASASAPPKHARSTAPALAPAVPEHEISP